jgi:carbonic anhydrase
MKPEGPRTAIVACMDARLDEAGFLDSFPTPVHVVRNAGGRITDDALRSLAVSCGMGARRIAVVHHTDCAMARHSDEQLRALLPDGADAEIDFLTIDDPARALREDVEAVCASSLLPAGIEVTGFVYDLEAGAPRELAGS